MLNLIHIKEYVICSNINFINNNNIKYYFINFNIINIYYKYINLYYNVTICTLFLEAISK